MVESDPGTDGDGFTPSTFHTCSTVLPPAKAFAGKRELDIIGDGPESAKLNRLAVDLGISGKSSSPARWDTPCSRTA